jgi:hypothetical protein
MPQAYLAEAFTEEFTSISSLTFILPKLYRRVSLISPLILVFTQAVIAEFTSFLI